MDRIYLDNNATTPLAPEVREAMLPYLADRFGNPSSPHRFGEEAARALDQARERLAGLIDGEADRVIFTGGGTEANNLAIWSAVQAAPEKRHIVTSRVEHASVLAPLAWLERQGYSVTRLDVASDGALSLEALAAAIRPETAVVSLMAANNETGVIFPLESIAAICRERGVLFHSDAVQYAGKEPLSMEHLPVDYLSLGAHKLHGPKGVGALYARRGAPVTPFLRGAGQEQGLRPGTENVAGIVGFGMAAELAASFLPRYRSVVGGLRARLEEGILAAVPDALVNGGTQPRLANTLSVSFRHAASGALVQELDERGIAVSAHAACHGGDINPSHVLTAMRVSEEYIHGTLRVSLDRYSSTRQAAAFLAVLPGIVHRSRGCSTP